MSQSSLLFCKKLKKDPEEEGFIVNSCDPCMVHEMIGGKQLTMVWHVDDVKVSHVNPKVNDKFMQLI